MRTLANTFWYRYAVRESKTSQFFNALQSGALSVTQIADGKALIAKSKKAGTIPRSAVPVISYHNEDSANTLGANVIFCDLSGTRALEEDIRNMNAVLTAAYNTAEISQSFDITNEFACRAYVNWIARAMASRYSIPLEDRYRLEVYLAAFYFTDGTPIFEYLKHTHIGRLAERIQIVTSGYNTAEIIRLLEDLPAFDIERHSPFHYQMLTDAIRTISPDLNSKIDDNSLFASISNSTGGLFAASGIYMACMAVEHRPTFLSLLYVYSNLRGSDKSSFGNTYIKSTVGNNKLKMESFVRQLAEIYKELEVKPYDI